MVRFLLGQKADLTQNLLGQYPLHLAFQTGAVDLLPLLRLRMLEQFNGNQLPVEPGALTPLQLGIRSRHLQVCDLARAASLSTCSLRTFIEEEPLCLPAFLRRLRGEAGLAPSKLAAHIRREDLDRLIVDCPEAALAMLDCCTSRPRVENIGQHPVPARVSFQARTTLEQVRNMLNPTWANLSFYEPETEWTYDAVLSEAPAWHNYLLGRSWGKPYRDADVKVCHLPNLVAAPFFAALVDASGGAYADEASLEIFKDPAVRGAIHYAWWNGACRLDLLHVFFSVWGLMLLIYDSMLGSAPTQLSDDFISAKGCVDLLFLLVRFAGWRACGSGWRRKLLTRETLKDLYSCVLPMMLPYAGGQSLVRILVVFSYWWQLLGFFTVSEYVARALLPILRLTNGLCPALTVTVVHFLAFVQAFQVVRNDGNSDQFTNWTETFATLLTASFPRKILESSCLEVGLCYVAISCFTVYFLNIFIGVIGELHQTEKGLCTETFQLVRSTKCMNFLACTHVLPCKLCSQWASTLVSVLAVFIGVVWQSVGLAANLAWPWTRTVLAACQVVLVLAAYQHENARWNAGGPEGNHYLWIVTAREEDDDERDLENPMEKDYSDGQERIQVEESIWHYRW